MWVRTTEIMWVGLGVVCLFVAVAPGETLSDRSEAAEAWKAGWPAYRGPSDDYAAMDAGISIHADPSKVRLLWKSESQDMPRGKAWSARDSVYGGAGHPGGGGSSPVVAFGMVYQFYTRPAGDVWYFVPRGARYPHKLFRVEADDVIHAVDLATGRTRWVRTFARGSINGQSMKSCIPDNHTPCVVGDTLVFLDPMWRLYGLDGRSGEWRWERGLTDRANERELTRARSLLMRTGTIGGHNLGLAYLQPVGDDLVLVNDQSGGIHAVSASDGATRWRVGGGKSEPQVSKWHQPAVWTHGDSRRLVLSTSEGVLCLDLTGGKEQWRIAGAIPHGHLVVVGDRLVGLGGVGAINPEANLMGHRGGVFGHHLLAPKPATGISRLPRSGAVYDRSRYYYGADTYSGRQARRLRLGSKRRGQSGHLGATGRRAATGHLRVGYHPDGRSRFDTMTQTLSLQSRRWRPGRFHFP